MAYKIFDVVVAPFPFTDRTAEKKRPALVLSDLEKTGGLSTKDQKAVKNHLKKLMCL